MKRQLAHTKLGTGHPLRGVSLVPSLFVSLMSFHCPYYVSSLSLRRKQSYMHVTDSAPTRLLTVPGHLPGTLQLSLCWPFWNH